MFHKKMKNSKNQQNAIMGAKTWQLALKNGESIYDHRFKLQMLLIQRSKQIPSVIFPRFQTDFQVLSSK
jgi:hypothetical protein